MNRGALAGLLTISLCVPASLIADDQAFGAMSLEQLISIKVQTASLHSQTIASAPAAVSVVTGAEIRKYGYRTLGEALNHVRGFFLTYDHTYYEANTGGFSVPGDWSTRILVLLNGHVMTDNIFGSASYFDEDFPLDMSLVDRIEIVRGPSSALYGSNGILATINVITKRADHEDGTEVLLQTGSLGERKLTATQALSLPKNASLLASATVFNNLGDKDIYFPEYDSPATNNGHAVNMDGARGYRFFANLIAGHWEILSVLDSRQKIQPISWAETVFNDRGTRALDQRSFVDALYTRNFDSDHVLRWRTYYDHYDFHGIYHYPLDDTGINVSNEFDAGDWAGTQLSYRFPLFHGSMTAGAEGKFDLRALESVADVQPVFDQRLLVDKRDKFADGFVQQEWAWGSHWSANLGARYDWSDYRSKSLSPRVALVYQPGSKTSIKLLYGRGFRNPNANELFFSDGHQTMGNLNLRPERADNVGVSVQRGWGRSWTGELSLYRMWDRDVIVPTYASSGIQLYENASSFRGQGIGMELSGRPASWLEVSANFQVQKSSLDGLTPPNSPGELGKLRFAVPLSHSKMSLSGGLLYQSERRSLAGAILPAVYLPEATLVTGRVWPGVDFEVGVRNLSNFRYVDPIGLAANVDTMAQDGRTFFIIIRSHTEGRPKPVTGRTP